MTGTATMALQPLFIGDLRSRRRSTLLASRSAGTAFLFENGGIVFGRYDASPSPAAHDRPKSLGWRLFAGRLMAR